LWLRSALQRFFKVTRRDYGFTEKKVGLHELFSGAVFTKKARPAEAKRRWCCKEPRKDDPNKKKERKSSKRSSYKKKVAPHTTLAPARGGPRHTRAASAALN
jgi:hypothetical protein